MTTIMTLRPLLAWLLALNAMCIIPFTYGPLTFTCLTISVWLLWRVQRLPEPSSPASTVWLWLVIAAGVLVVLASIASATLIKPDPMIDIGINTLAATEHFANGLNPYTHKAQLWVNTFPAETPHLTIEEGQVFMFGIPYHHGYPYFPLMMLSYLPAWFLFDGPAAIRALHILLIGIHLLAFHIIIRNSAISREQQPLVLLYAIAAWIGILRNVPEAIVLGVTDIMIATWLLLGFAALSSQRYFMAGILVGCAQACKLLPAPFAFIAIVWMLYQRREAWHFIGGFAISCIILILPFIAWNWEGFLSSTILYYLTHHQEGDMTSLWYFLPHNLQGPFLLFGLAASLASIFLFNPPGRKTLAGGMAGIFAGYTLFMAFSKMTHLNYFWSVLPLGSLALALLLLTQSGTRGTTTPSR